MITVMLSMPVLFFSTPAEPRSLRMSGERRREKEALHTSLRSSIARRIGKLKKGRAKVGMREITQIRAERPSGGGGGGSS